MKKKQTVTIIAVMFLFLLSGLPAYAAGNAKIMEVKCEDNQLLAFVKDAGNSGEISAMLGKTPCDHVKRQTLQELEVEIRTLILIDNSLSIPDGSREKLRTELAELVASKKANEYFALGTVSDHVEIILDFTDDYTQFKDTINSLTYQYQDTYLTDALYDYLIEDPFGGSFKTYDRILLISDGVDNKSIGYTKDELLSLLKQAPVPVYAVGITNWNEHNNEEIEQMFEIARFVNGGAYLLDDLGQTVQLPAAMGEDRDILAVSLPVPESAQDGSLQTLTLDLGEHGKISMDQIRMPLLPEEPEPAPAPEPEPEPEPELEETNGMLYILPLAGVVILALAAVLIVFLLKNKKSAAGRGASPTEKPDIPDSHGQAKADTGGGATQLLTDDGDDGGERGGTVGLWEQKSQCNVTLTDVHAPERLYQKPITTSLIVGYSQSSDICINYDKTVSHRHCEIIKEGSDIYLVNHSQSNGTLLNGYRVTTRVPLPSGSIIKMGRVEMRVTISF